ncbi:MAG: ParB/RepB/Spo0J family partition protein, partial [Alphaproteobacteria bacterium]|nr:ParB/RepB/Spo0J family partition protein [Alphaproteobacteria bacterium]
VQSLSDTDVAAVALVENLQRQDLNPIEEAAGYSRLVTELRLTHEALAKVVGKSRAHVTNVLRLLHLPESVQHAVREGRLTFGHARALAAHSDPESVLPLVLARQLNVRQTEALANRAASGPQATTQPVSAGADTLALGKELAEWLGLPVEISRSGAGGSLRIRFRDLDQLDHLVKRLRHSS